MIRFLTECWGIDYFTGLGIFFDTYANARHSYQWPRVTAMMGDGKTSYDHDHDNAENEFAACSVSNLCSSTFNIFG